MSEQGIKEHDLARRKAASRLGVTASKSAPRNEEIDAALIEYHRIYKPQTHAEELAHVRKLAAEAMRYLAAFMPLLSGAVWDGTANRFSHITLHIFADTPEDVRRRLTDGGIPFDEDERLPHIDDGRQSKHPTLTFYVDGTAIELLLFPLNWKGRTLRKRGEQRPGGALADVLKLLAQHTSPGPEK